MARHRNDIPAALLKQVSQHVAAGQAGGTCDKCNTLLRARPYYRRQNGHASLKVMRLI